MGGRFEPRLHAVIPHQHRSGYSSHPDAFHDCHMTTLKMITAMWTMGCPACHVHNTERRRHPYLAKKRVYACSPTTCS
jgi:hypothetical protein